MEKRIINVEVLGKSGETKNRYRLKVSVHDLGLHIMGMIVQDSIIDGVQWHVTPPAHAVNGRYYKDITFEKQSQLWRDIEAACIACIEEYLEL